MKKEASLGKLTIMYAFGNFSSKILRFGMFFIYTFFLSKEDIGFYDLVVTSVLIATPLISCQVYDALFRNILETNKSSLIAKYLTNSLVLICINLLIFTFAFFAFGSYLNVEFKVFIYLYVVSETIYLLFPQLARGVGENRIFVSAGILYSLILFTSSILLLVVFKFGVKGLIISSILAGGIGSVFIFIRLNASKYIRFNSLSFETIKAMANYSLPLIPNTLSWWAISNANRFLILKDLGLEANGFYAVGQKLPAILMMLTSIFNLAWTEKAILAYTGSSRTGYFNEVFNKYLTLLFSLVLIMISTSKIVLLFIVDSSYFSIWKFLPFLYVATFFQALSTFLGTGYISSKETKGAFFTTVYGSVINLILAYLLIPILGLNGAALAVCIGFYVMFQIRFFSTKKYFEVKISKSKVFKLIFLAVIVGLIYMKEDLYFHIFNSALSIAVFGILNRDLVSKVCEKGRGKIVKIGKPNFGSE